MGNVIDFSIKVREADLDKLVTQLSQRTFELMITNRELELKLAHLEELLKHAPVLDITKGKR